MHVILFIMSVTSHKLCHYRLARRLLNPPVINLLNSLGYKLIIDINYLKNTFKFNRVLQRVKQYYRVIHDLSPPPWRGCISVICISLKVHLISGYKSKFSFSNIKCIYSLLSKMWSIALDWMLGA